MTVEGDRAAVDFAPALARRAATTTSGLAFLLELRANVFQFAALEHLALSVSGDCERFWRLLESVCRVVERRG